MMERFSGDTLQGRQPMIELGTNAGIGKPEETAEEVLWLCSDRASFVTGHVMSVDGGFVVR